MWKIVLKDGVWFVGDRTWRHWWSEGFFERTYRVFESPTLPVGCIIRINMFSIAYKIREEK